MTDVQSPKLFISYSWSTQEHEQWVMALATELRESGVDVILDKWDLKDGHDSIQFMESMVTDESVTKVIMVSDKIYAQKADGRAGGVGTETQIISAKVYEKAKQDKFVAVVAEKEDGKACLPTFYGKRKYIDLSEADDYAKNFEMLLRWVFDKPLHVKPEVGALPAFLSDSTAVNLGTSAALRRALDAVKQGKPFAAGAVDEYFRAVSQGFEKIRIEKENGKEFDDQLIESIEAFIPYRNEIVSLVVAIAQYDSPPSMNNKIHRFLESLLPYADRPAHVNQYRESDFDNFKFLINEIFLYVLAIFLKYEKFESAQILLSTPYYIHERTSNGQSGVFGYSVFYEYVRTLDYRNQRLRLGRLSLAADLLKDRSQSSDLDFNHLMQADLILFLRGTQTGERWFPNTLLYANRSYGPFEIFARSMSQKYFDSVKTLIGVADKRELGALLLNYKGPQSQLPRWQFDSFNPEILVGYDMIGTRP
ncbi:TIR domain-containing protein [Pseudomonas salmasensis]|uniref:TIR domain-containing protein n=1 Tax=Pseudomonas salmasensis TaxID=2745514 RepID=A0ABU5FB94_9PSED|nr:SEFIR domain-containing protein [Pseudomonas salmasensis]MDY4298530.1 TIR domain-containing protein [Pseudomonas salmasensis]